MENQDTLPVALPANVPSPPIAVFYSQMRSLSLTFAPEQFGMGENAFGAKAPYANLTFHDGRLEVYPLEEKHLGPGQYAGGEDMAVRLRNHQANAEYEPNGPCEYNEAPRAALEYGAYAARKPTIVLQSDVDNLDYLERKAETKSMLPEEPKKVVAVIGNVVQRFNVRAYVQPENADVPIRVLKGKISELLYILEKEDITKEMTVDADDRGQDS